MTEKRILHIVSSLGVDSGVMGVIMNYYRNIDLDTLQFDFLYFQEKEFTHIEEIEALGGNVYFLPKPSMKSLKLYKDFFEEKKSMYKTLHLHEIYLNAILLPIAKKRGFKHLIVHSHATKFSDKKLNAIRNRMLCLPINHTATNLFACSKAAGRAVFGSKKLNAVTIVNNAVDTSKFKFDVHIREKIRKEMNLEPNQLLLGHVGRFNEQKNHRFLLEIFKEYLDKHDSKARLLLIGNGPLFEEINDLAFSLGINEAIFFLGKKSNVHEYMSAMDIFLLPSLFEGLPVVGVEAQSTGLPIIFSKNITDEIGVANFSYQSIDHEEDKKAWCKEIDRLTNSSNNRTIAEEIITNQGFNIKNESRKLQQIYLRLD